MSAPSVAPTPAARSRKRAAKEPLTPRARWKKRLKVTFLVTFILINVAVVGSALYAKQRLDEAAQMVPRLPEIMREVISTPSVIVSADGQTLFAVASEFREPVRFQDIPPNVIEATLAAEDRRFYDHEGVDPIAMARVTFVYLTSGRATQGGSTLTMQLAKRVYTSNARTVDRKIQDMALAMMIERMLTKDQILELYLNQVFYGNGAYGVSAAADVYFGKDLDQLTLGEAAMLARIVRRPSQENPIDNPEKAKQNRDLVLRLMHEEKYITQQQYDKAVAEPVKVRRRPPNTVTGVKVAPYFVDYVLDQLRRRYPDIDLSKGGYRIETTLDMRLQTVAQEEVERTIERNRHLRITTAAFVLTDDEGRILAMVGGADYNRNQFNAVSQGRRQPGSAFKPFVYAAAFEYGALSPFGSVSNAPYFYKTGSGRQKKISGGGGGGSVSVRTALARSINTPAMWAIDEVGPQNVVSLAKSGFGFTSPLDPVPALALGSSAVSPLEMAEAYSVFQHNGDRVTPFGIGEIIGPDGLPIKRFAPVVAPRVLSTSAAEGVDSLLRAVVTGGTGTRAAGVTNARGKTGTTNDNRDAWFCGYTDRFVGIGWVGNEQRTPQGTWIYPPMRGVFGGAVVAPMWARIMERVQDEYPEPKRSLGGATRRVDVEAAPEQPPALEEIPMPDEPDDAAPSGADLEPVPPPVTAPGAAGVGAGAAPPAGEEGLVYVEVCADSGQRATVYCPERVRRGFRPGTEPRGACPLHRGPGP